MKKTDEPIVIEETFDVSIQKLWKAITDINCMTKWFFENIKSFEPRVGFETRFIIKNEDRIFPHLWKITDVRPEKSISYNWKYEGFEGDSFVRFELSENGKGSKLMLTHTVTETFPQNIAEFKSESCIEGWNWFIKNRLKEYLQKQK